MTCEGTRSLTLHPIACVQPGGVVLRRGFEVRDAIAEPVHTFNGSLELQGVRERRGKASWSASSQIRHAPGMSRPAILTNRAEGSSNQSGSGAATVRDGSPVTGSHCGACYSSLLQGAAGGGVSAISSFTARATTSRYRGLRPIRKCQHSAPHQVTPFTHPFRCYDAMTPRVRKKNLQFSVIPA